MLNVARGLAQILSDVRPIYFEGNPEFYDSFMGKAVLGIPNVVFVMFGAAIVAHLVLTKTVLGRYTFALGSNEEATRLSGVNVDAWKISVYAVSGLFAGLAGMGDLIVTCWSKSGRNRRAGELIAQGATPAEAMAEIGMVVEGLTTAPVLRDLSRRLGIEMPITEGVCTVLEGVPLSELVATLMQRDPTSE